MVVNDRDPRGVVKLTENKVLLLISPVGRSIGVIDDAEAHALSHDGGCLASSVD